MQTWYLYIIENKLGHFYTGITTDVARRFHEHQSASPRCAKALRGKQPLILRFHCTFANKSDAIKAEIWTKQRSRKEKQQIMQGQLLPPAASIGTSLDATNGLEYPKR